MAVPIIPKSECYNKPSKKSSSFGLEMNASTLKALSQTLYDYKIEAVLREYSTNITDSHNDSGKEGLAGYVHVPTKLKPVVEFHDSGLGMSEDTIFSVYTVFGCSTKRDDNTTNGSLGFGSKSFNTVSDQMTVTSTKDGTKTVVLCYKDRKGELTADIKSSTKTDEPNGTVVSIPVDPAKVSQWQSAAARVLGAFRVPHKTNGFGAYEAEYQQMLTLCEEVRDSGTKFYKNTNNVMGNMRSRHWVLMGDVLYTLPDFHSLLPSKGSYVDSVKCVVDTGMYVTHFNIGEVDHHPSRESISYDEDTFIKCKHRVRQDTVMYLRNFQRELGDIKNISLYRFFHKYKETAVYESLWEVPLPFLRGNILSNVCPRQHTTWGYKKLLLLANKERYGKIRGMIPDANGYSEIFSSAVELLDQKRLVSIRNPLIMYSDNPKGIYKIRNTIDKASETLNREHALVVDSLEMAQNVYDFFGEGDVICGDEFSPEKTKRKSGKGGKRGSLGIKEDYQTAGTVYTLRDNGYSSQFEMVDLSGGGVCYMQQDGIKVTGVVKGTETKLLVCSRVATLLFRAGVTKVVVENQNNKGKISRSGIADAGTFLTNTVKPLKKDIIKAKVWSHKYGLCSYDEPLRDKLTTIKKFDERLVKPEPILEAVLGVSDFNLKTTKLYENQMETKRKLIKKVDESLENTYNKLPLWKTVRTMDEDSINHYLKLEKFIK